MTILVFEDEHATQLYPITVGRPAYAISCGSYRLVDWLRTLDAPVRGVVRAHLAEIQKIDFSDLHPPLGQHARRTDAGSHGNGELLVNARLVPSASAGRALRELLAAGRPGVVRTESAVAAALLPASAALPPHDLGVDQLSDYFHSAGLNTLPLVDVELPLFDYPHDVIRYNLEILGENLEHRLAHGAYKEVAGGVFAAANAKLGEYVVSDTSGGPIVLEENASIGPYCYLKGPAFLGKGARVIEHSAIKDAVSIGHTTKVGGEVEASVIEPYTNKQHHGFLGHSYLGSWINLGAGTCNSDLKNTYGKVNMEYRGERVSTGMQFVGCIMGDYAKSAINTGIFTGKTIGTCSMVYGFVTTNVPSFVNYARLFGQVTELPPEVMIASQQRMFQRRSVAQRPCDVQLIHDMYELTRHERQLAGEPLSL
jgi:UDP-N-acetylglucosamine diphosphorylase/glucosamine-1-phosphate N-acetyltransferase